MEKMEPLCFSSPSLPDLEVAISITCLVQNKLKVSDGARDGDVKRVTTLTLVGVVWQAQRNQALRMGLFAQGILDALTGDEFNRTRFQE